MLRTGGDWTKWNLSATTSTTATSWIYINTLWESTVAMEHPVKILYKWRFTVSLNEKITHQIWNHTWNCWSLSATVRMSLICAWSSSLKDLKSLWATNGNQYSCHNGHCSCRPWITWVTIWSCKTSPVLGSWPLPGNESAVPSPHGHVPPPGHRHGTHDLTVWGSQQVYYSLVGAFCWWCKHV